MIDFSKYYNSLNILMQLIQSPIPMCNKLTHKDWNLLFDCLDILYDKSLHAWLAKQTCLSDEEIALCYFCKIGVRHSHLAIFFSISSQSLSKRKQRLKNKLGIAQATPLEDLIKSV